MNSAPNAPWLGLPVERAKLSTPALGVAEKWLSEYFANCWDGTGLVVEIGLFPGAATRAIAHGMAANPRRQGEAVLHAFHGFDDGLAGRELREAIGTMMLLHVGPLPDRPDEIDDCISLDCLTDQGVLGALVIDGCKSWASTHYVMKFLLPRLRVGAPVIFQDFGSYPCFWISSVAYALREFLVPGAQVDSTSVFHLTRRVSENDVAKRFARTPLEMGEVFFRKAAAALLERSLRSGDLRGELIAQLHHVAALVTIGRRGAATHIFKHLDIRRYSAHAGMIIGSLRSPTYLPGGEQLLWKEAA